MEWYAIKMLVVSQPETAIKEAAEDLVEELEKRENLENPTAVWEKGGGLLVEVRNQGLTREKAEKGAREELFEALNAVVRDFESFRIDVLV